MQESAQKESSANVPASSSSLDVEVRTMASDIEMLGQAGGALPPSEKVWFARKEQSSGSAPSRESRRENAQGEAVGALPAEQEAKKFIFWVVGILAGIVALFLLGFFVYPFFFGGQ